MRWVYLFSTLVLTKKLLEESKCRVEVEVIVWDEMVRRS